jgi:carbonic anhydrase/acetyltransferase-like protein (isoleucine patch superfamily)
MRVIPTRLRTATLGLLPRLRLRALHACDLLRLRWLRWQTPGLEIHPGASANLAWARYRLAPGARLVIGDGVVTERRRDGVCFSLEPDATVTIGAGTWLRSELGPVHLVAFEGARLEVGPEGFLNGCHLSAKREVTLGRRVWVGPGSRVFDSDQHDFDAERPERSAPVRLGDHTWIGSDVTVLRGVTVGEHCVVGARSLLTRDLPPHTLAFGAPAVPRGPVGDRSAVR